MDYKEKLEEAKRLYETANADQKYLLESLFPELKSKADERIRKNCIHFLKLQKSHHASTVEIDECIDWLEGQVKYLLEKQGEERTLEKDTKTFLEALSETPYNNMPIVQAQAAAKQLLAFLTDPKSYNPDSEVEPKFKAGDWVICEVTGFIYQIKDCIENTSNHRFGYDLENGGYVSSDVANHYHLWTIKDAKNGDVLATDDWVFIFEKIRSNGKPVCYCHYDVDLGFVIDVNTYISTGSTIRPATEEQWNLLYQKMKEAGYEWDAEKKELKKIEQKSDSYCRENCKGFQETGKCFADGECKAKIEAEQKPTWSDEDVAMLDSAIAFVSHSPFTVIGKGKSNVIAWLKSLKDRYTWKPSEEQIKALNEVLNFAANHESSHWNDYIFGTLNNLIRQLKKLKG